MAESKANEKQTGETADDFSGDLCSRVFDAFAMVSIGLGSKLGLFDVMSKFTEPKTSQEIADAAGFKERYVREWLGTMVTGHIIKLDESGKKYYIPEHRKSVLTEPDQPGVYSQCLFNIIQCQHELEKCFKRDGPPGVPYSSYPGIHEMYGLLAVAEHTWEGVKSRLSQAPGLMNMLESGTKVCEFGTGSGLAARHVAERFPKSEVLGLDISEETIATAQEEAKKKGLSNCHYKVQDICSMPEEWSERWDVGLMFDVAHDVPFTTTMLKDVYRVMKPGGLFIMKEMDVHSEHKDNLDVPMARMVYAFSVFHCMPVSLSVEGGEGLGAAWGIEAPRAVLKGVGFDIIHQDQALFVCKKPL